ncbi:hypothetical protein GCM10022405_40950 [Gibbsiella dentisursi]|uniref:Uncharacterized protein n=1 Tax=Gibbsiella dentisursi TaxID=796890 RepID=A0ABP7M207_9GAMM
MDDVELVEAFTEARRSERLQLLDLLSSKLDRLSASDASREQVISALKSWIDTRKAVGAPAGEKNNEGNRHA